MAKPQILGPPPAYMTQFMYPMWNPPLSLGVQFMEWGEGGPSGDLHIKGTTPQPMATNIGFCGMPVVQAFPRLIPMAMGTPRTRPGNPQVAFGQVAVFEPMATIRGIMKSPTNGGA